MKFRTADEAYNYLVESAKREGISKVEIAKKLGVSKQHISNTLKRGNVKLSSLKKLADKLGVEIELTLKDQNHDKEGTE